MSKIAPRKIWAFHDGPMVGLFIGKEEVGTNIAGYVRSDIADDLLSALKAMVAVAEKQGKPWRNTLPDGASPLGMANTAISKAEGRA